MRTLHAYVLRQVLGTLVMTVGVFMFFILVIKVLREVLGLLVTQQVSLPLVGKAIALIVPEVLVIALPTGLLTAALLVFGRFSADNEITAIRASGISLVSLVTPVLILGVLLSGVSAVITMYVAPQCKVASKKMLREIGLSKSTALIPAKTYIRDFPDVILYVSHVAGPYLEDVHIYELRRDKVASYIRANSGEIAFSTNNNLIFVRLTNVYRVFFVEDRRLPQPPFVGEAEFVYTNTTTRRAGRAELDNMTMPELQQTLRELELQMSAPLRLPDRAGREPDAAGDRREAERAKRARKTDLAMPVRVQMHKQVAFSFACIGFTLVGIPLGIRAHRRETSFGIAVAILLVLVYYSFFIVGVSLATKPEAAPHLILWIPNLAFQVAGGVLLWRANRGV